jgi:excisionase family DNA binding protein
MPGIPTPDPHCDPRYLTAAQAADLLGIHRVTLWRWVRAEKIKPLLRHGDFGQLIFRRSEVDRVAAKREQASA